MADTAEIYRKVACQSWADEKVMALTKPQPNGQSLWFYLLTGLHTNPIPGLFSIGEMALAEHFDWPLKGFRKAFREVSAKGMVEADWKARVVYLPNALKHNFPASPNVVISWRRYWSLIPECRLKLKVWGHLERGLSDTEAFVEAFRKACRKPFAKPSPNQEQEQDQELEQENTPLKPPQGGASTIEPAPRKRKRRRDPQSTRDKLAQKMGMT